jgi:hypothetical protein
MYREENCGCGEHGKHHGEKYVDEQKGHHEDCGCGCHENHGMHVGWDHQGGCRCGCDQHHRGMRFHRRFISHEEIVARLEEYLKHLKAEAKGVEEHLAEIKKRQE